jgi:hypothetical protein
MCTCWAVQWEALAYLGGGFAFFGLVGLAAKYNNKASKKPYVSCSCHPCATYKRLASTQFCCFPCLVRDCQAVLNLCLLTVHADSELCYLLQTPREFPFDNLKEELGGGFGPQALEERMQASASEG